ncbi:MAG: hypothetical protein ACOX6P_02485 [Candidatus Merdivicinus sp.]|jgi:hypothetical protein
MMNRVLDDLIASAKNLADKAGKATDKAVEYSKLKYQSVQLASELRGLYEKLGNAVYTMVKSDFDNKDLMDSIISEIDHVKDSLQDINVQIAEYKNSVVCPACGAVNDKDACYCNKCGNKFVPKTEEETVCCEEEDSCSCGEETCECGCNSEEPKEDCCCKNEGNDCTCECEKEESKPE